MSVPSLVFFGFTTKFLYSYYRIANNFKKPDTEEPVVATFAKRYMLLTVCTLYYAVTVCLNGFLFLIFIGAAVFCTICISALIQGSV